MWYLDEHQTVSRQYPLPKNTIEIAITPLRHETLEEAVRNVIAYMTDDCIRLGIRHIRFICRSSDCATRQIEAHHTGGALRDASILTKERLYAAFR